MYYTTTFAHFLVWKETVEAKYFINTQIDIKCPTHRIMDFSGLHVFKQAWRILAALTVGMVRKEFKIQNKKILVVPWTNKSKMELHT